MIKEQAHCDVSPEIIMKGVERFLTKATGTLFLFDGTGESSQSYR